MPIRFACKCGKQFKAADKFAGKRVKCPQCGIEITIPDITPPEPETPPAPEPQPDIQVSGGFGLDLDDLTGDKTEGAAAAKGTPGEETQEHLGGASLELASDDEPTLSDQVQETKDNQMGFDLASAADAQAAGPKRAKGKSPPQPAGKEGARACPKCGVPAGADAVICLECGAKLDQQSAKPGKAAKGRVAAKRLKSKKVLIGIGGGLLIVVLALVAFLLLKPGKPKPVAAGREPGEPPSVEPQPPSGRQPQAARPKKKPKIKNTLDF